MGLGNIGTGFNYNRNRMANQLTLSDTFHQWNKTGGKCGKEIPQNNVAPKEQVLDDSSC